MNLSVIEVLPYRVILQCHYQVCEVGLDTREVELEHIELVAVNVERYQRAEEGGVD